MNEVQVSSLDGIAHKHGYSHWAHSTWDRGDFGGLRRHFLKVHISNQSIPAFAGGIFNPVYSYINDDGSFLDHVLFDKTGFSDGSDQDVRLFGDGRKICSSGMAVGYGRISKGVPPEEE
jgi:hypothetical protein